MRDAEPFVTPALYLAGNQNMPRSVTRLLLLRAAPAALVRPRPASAAADSSARALEEVLPRLPWCCCCSCSVNSTRLAAVLPARALRKRRRRLAGRLGHRRRVGEHSAGLCRSAELNLDWSPRARHSTSLFGLMVFPTRSEQAQVSAAVSAAQAVNALGQRRRSSADLTLGCMASSRGTCALVLRRYCTSGRNMSASSSVRMVLARPDLPARPVLPMRWV